jgi:hypothetical protein
MGLSPIFGIAFLNNWLQFYFEKIHDETIILKTNIMAKEIVVKDKEGNKKIKINAA